MHLKTPTIALSTPGSSTKWPGLIAHLRHLITLRRERRALAAMEDHMLKDIGLTRAEALEEAAQPLWAAPAHWTRGNR
jgi:uncharacterized protein YjiS (DUF1127 family)